MISRVEELMFILRFLYENGANLSKQKPERSKSTFNKSVTIFRSGHCGLEGI